jgi:hypothetical protein
VVAVDSVVTQDSPRADQEAAVTAHRLSTVAPRMLAVTALPVLLS